MPITRVQATPKALAASVTAVSATFAAPPVVGNGIVVAVLTSSNGAFSSSGCSDNRGNAYTMVGTGAALSGPGAVAVYFCAAVTSTGGPFTVTVAPGLGSVHFVAVAIEVGGGLAVESSAFVGSGIGTTIATPSHVILSVDNAFYVALVAIGTAQASIAVTAITPPWAQEIEELTSGPYIAGEVDTRIVTTASGTAVGATWTIPTSSWFEAAIVAFKAGAGGGGGAGTIGPRTLRQRRFVV